MVGGLEGLTPSLKLEPPKEKVLEVYTLFSKCYSNTKIFIYSIFFYLLPNTVRQCFDRKLPVFITSLKTYYILKIKTIDF